MKFLGILISPDLESIPDNKADLKALNALTMEPSRKSRVGRE